MAISPFGVFSSGVKTSGEGFSPEFEKAIAIIKNMRGYIEIEGTLSVMDIKLLLVTAIKEEQILRKNKQMHY